jgi:hypothetical protein
MEKHGKSEISHTSPQPAGCVFLLLPAALRAKHSQKGIAKDFFGKRTKKKKTG